MSAYYQIWTYTFKSGDPKTIWYKVGDTISGQDSMFGYGGLFERSSVISVTIPEGVKVIGPRTFEYCNDLASITIPTTIERIDTDAFIGCDSLPADSDGVVYVGKLLVRVSDTTKTSLTIKPGTKWIGYGAFSDCSSIETLNIPDTVEEIGYNILPYYYNNSFKYLTIGSGLTNCLSPSSFMYGNWDTISVSASNRYYDSRNSCNAIIEKSTNKLITGSNATTIPSTVTEICNSAFYRKTRLTSITIPSSVTVIGNAAFQGCSLLESVIVESTTPPTMRMNYSQYDTFSGNKSGRKIYVPAASVDAYKAAEGWSTYAADIMAMA